MVVIRIGPVSPWHEPLVSLRGRSKLLYLAYLQYYGYKEGQQSAHLGNMS